MWQKLFIILICASIATTIIEFKIYVKCNLNRVFSVNSVGTTIIDRVFIWLSLFLCSGDISKIVPNVIVVVLISILIKNYKTLRKKREQCLDIAISKMRSTWHWNLLEYINKYIATVTRHRCSVETHEIFHDTNPNQPNDWETFSKLKIQR